MKVMIFGAGVLGSYYASRLARAGIDVTILARGDKLKSIRERGIILEDFFTAEQTVTRVPAVESPEPEWYDLVVIFVQMIHLESVLPVLKKMKATKSFLFMGNNVYGFDGITKQLGRERVLAGFGGIGGTRRGHIVVYADSSGEKKEKFDSIIVGELHGGMSPRLQQIIDLFAGADIRVIVPGDIDGWLKTHTVVIAGLAGALYMCDADNYRLAQNHDDLILMLKAIKEGLRILEVLGITIEPGKYRLFKLIPNFILVNQFRSLIGSRFAEIALAGHASAAREEIQGLVQGVLELAEKASIKTPVLNTLIRHI